MEHVISAPSVVTFRIKSYMIMTVWQILTSR